MWMIHRLSKLQLHLKSSKRLIIPSQAFSNRTLFGPHRTTSEDKRVLGTGRYKQIHSALGNFDCIFIVHPQLELRHSHLISPVAIRRRLPLLLIFQKTRQGDVCLMIQQTRLGLFPLNVEDELPLITIVGGGPSWKRSCVEEASVWDGISPHKIVLFSFPGQVL